MSANSLEGWPPAGLQRSAMLVTYTVILMPDVNTNVLRLDAYNILDVAIPQLDEQIIMFQASHDADLYADEIASAKLHTTVPSTSATELPVIQLDYRNSSDHGRVQINSAYLQDCRNFWSVTEEVTWYNYLHQARKMVNEGSDLVLVVTPYAPLMPATRLTSIQRLSSRQHNSSCIGRVNE